MRRSQTAVVISLLLLAAIVVWVLWPVSGGPEAETGSPLPASPAPEKEQVAGVGTEQAAPVTRTAAPVTTPDTPPASATITTRPTAQSEQPTLGGLVSPGEVEWITHAPSGSLAYLLRQQLARSLLDPLSGEGQLAEKWEMEGARVTFTLPMTTTWSNGASLTASDVAGALRRSAEEGVLPALRRVRATGLDTVVVELSAPSCPALMQVATWPIIADGGWPPAYTSGAYTVSEEQDGTWSFEPDGPRYRTYEDELALRSAWERGEIDGIVGGRQLAMGPLAGGRASGQEGPLLATLLFRLEDPLVSEPGLREALTLATDRALLSRVAYGREPTALPTALLPAGHWAAPVEPLLVSISRAEALLSRAGWEDRDGDGVRENAEGEPLRLVLTIPLSLDHRWERLASALAEQWARVGVDLMPRFLEEFALQERLHNAQWQVALVAYVLAPDPDQRALWTTPTDIVGEDLNITGYQAPDVADLLEEGAKLPGCAPQERAAVYRRAWERIIEERPLWPLFALPLDIVWQSPSGG